MSNKNKKPESSAPDAGSLDKVRDILFGEQSRRSEQRFGALEARLAKELAEARAAHQTAMDGLQAKLAEAVKTLEAAGRQGAGEQAEQLKAAEAQLTGRIAEVEAAMEAGQEKLRSEVDAQHEAMRADLRAARDEQTAATVALAAALRGELVDRGALAGMFVELADRLGAEDGRKGRGGKGK